MLPAMILGALFIHGLAFYLVQTSAPNPGKKWITSARLTMLDPANPRDRELLEWIENHDPAVISQQPTSPEPPGLFAGIRYQPSYENVLPEPLPLLSEEKKWSHQSLFPPGAVPETAARSPLPVHDWPTLPTKIVLSDQTQITRSAPFSPPVIKGDIPSPSRFLVVIGEYRTALFLLQSSGNDRLDDYARTWLAGAAFSGGVRQTRVDFFWGADVWGKPAP